jgi:hypothetical protein
MISYPQWPGTGVDLCWLCFIIWNDLDDWTGCQMFSDIIHEQEYIGSNSTMAELT